MAEENARTWPPVRRRKPIPKWKRFLRKYWPTIRFGLILAAAATVLILVAVLMVSCTIGLFSKDPQETQPAEPTETSISQEEIDRLAQQCLQEAEFVAAGYDYEKAINILESFPYYEKAPRLAQQVETYLQEEQTLIPYRNMYEITHVFFHSLIVDPARAFDNEYTNKGYNQFMTTIDEFEAILEEMYNRGYVLVSPYDVAYEVTDSTGTHFVYGDIRLPEGKKPFIMSQDDVNYYGYMVGANDGTDDIPAFPDKTGDGFATKLVIGEDGYPTCQYMDENGNVTTGDYDLVPILERFIQEHPDFSYHGARAILAMTGYEGVFGYRTKPAYEAALGTEAYQKEVAEAKKVAQCLREHGWILGSHSYGHPSYGGIDAQRVALDSDKFEKTVESVIGEVDVLIFPHGADIAGIEPYTMENEKFSVLYEDGYRYFFNVDGTRYWNQLGDTYYRGGRRNLDGIRMYYYPDMLDDLFDAEKVFDPARPTPVPNI